MQTITSTSRRIQLLIKLNLGLISRIVSAFRDQMQEPGRLTAAVQVFASGSVIHSLQGVSSDA
jgi:hypothetical protein